MFSSATTVNTEAMSTYSDSESAKTAIVTVHSILTIVNIIGNSLVCVVIIKNKATRYF